MEYLKFNSFGHQVMTNCRKSQDKRFSWVRSKPGINPPPFIRIRSRITTSSWPWNITQNVEAILNYPFLKYCKWPYCKMMARMTLDSLSKNIERVPNNLWNSTRLDFRTPSLPYLHRRYQKFDERLLENIIHKWYAFIIPSCTCWNFS